jgi:glutathione synthase/RimK-type ligase-like ATP-grasp enzyme
MSPDRGLKAPLLIVGGDSDPNITALLAAVGRGGVTAFTLLFGKDSHPALTWEIVSGRLSLDGEALGFDAAFVRHDVFTALQDGSQSSQYRALAWYTAITGWLAANPQVFIFNRRNLNHVTNKPLVLKLAQDSGLAIPETLITNDFQEVARFVVEQQKIVKPVNGGGYCEALDEVADRTQLREGRAAAPAIVQRRLVPPELRVYAVGGNYFGFNVISPELDYRTTQNCRLEYVAQLPTELTTAFASLLEKLGLDFAAADFKTCPDTGRLMFLEVNTGPMFAAFDRASEGRLCDAMVTALMGDRVFTEP